MIVIKRVRCVIMFVREFFIFGHSRQLKNEDGEGGIIVFVSREFGFGICFGMNE